MSRWKVYRTSDEINPWATRYDGWQDGSLIIRKAHHGTWAEAMHYADQQARTIEVTLPPVVEHPSDDVPDPAWHMPGEFIRHWISTAHGKVWMTDHRGLGDLMDADVAERRGLALIAAAKHAKGELS